MQRYFFHVSDGTELPDVDGKLLPDLRAARRHAAALLGRLMSEAPDDIWEGVDWQVVVKDQRGLHLLSIHIVTVQSAIGRASASFSRPH